MSQQLFFDQTQKKIPHHQKLMKIQTFRLFLQLHHDSRANRFVSDSIFKVVQKHAGSDVKDDDGSMAMSIGMGTDRVDHKDAAKATVTNTGKDQDMDKDEEQGRENDQVQLRDEDKDKDKQKHKSADKDKHKDTHQGKHKDKHEDSDGHKDRAKSKNDGEDKHGHKHKRSRKDKDTDENKDNNQKLGPNTRGDRDDGTPFENHNGADKDNVHSKIEPQPQSDDQLMAPLLSEENGSDYCESKLGADAAAKDEDGCEGEKFDHGPRGTREGGTNDAEPCVEDTDQSDSLSGSRPSGGLTS